MPAGPTAATLHVGSTTQLAVNCLPGAPVTFVIMDMGAFPNGRASQTVTADAAGFASISYRAIPGVIGMVHVLAGSPATSGQVDFVLNVEPSQTK